MSSNRGERYPLRVQLPGGRVQHAARPGAGDAVHTLCRQYGTPAGDGAHLPYCAACGRKPNPIRQQDGVR